MKRRSRQWAGCIVGNQRKGEQICSQSIAQDSLGGSMATTRRTTMRSTKGKKLYAVRNADGTFKDIQTYERASRADQARTAKQEKPRKRAKAKAKSKARSSR